MLNPLRWRSRAGKVMERKKFLCARLGGVQFQIEMMIAIYGHSNVELKRWFRTEVCGEPAF